MPSSVAHGLAAAALGILFYPAERPRLYIATAAGAVLLDLDAIGRPFGLGDVGWLGGHRALTHSLPFAAALAIVMVAAICRGDHWQSRRVGVWAYFALAIALHGVFDALTTYGEGVMFFAPVSTLRIKSPWLPLDDILPEVVLIWAPAIYVIRRHRPNRQLDASPPTA